MRGELHLVKLCVGVLSVADLRARQKRGALYHVTRMMPRRAAELVDGGALYWVIKGKICVRQRITALEPIRVAGVRHCRIRFDRTLVATLPQPRRPFQGWRYLAAADAPPDLAMGDDMPAGLRGELAALGLL